MHVCSLDIVHVTLKDRLPTNATNNDSYLKHSISKTDIVVGFLTKPLTPITTQHERGAMVNMNNTLVRLTGLITWKSYKTEAKEECSAWEVSGLLVCIQCQCLSTIGSLRSGNGVQGRQREIVGHSNVCQTL